MNLYKLTKQDLENLNKLNNIEDVINIESERLRAELYENENEEEISLSSFRYGKLVFLYNNWKNAWKEALYLSVVPFLASVTMCEKSVRGIVSFIFMFLIGIGMVISGLRGRHIMNKIKSNFDELELDLDNLD